MRVKTRDSPCSPLADTKSFERSRSTREEELCNDAYLSKSFCSQLVGVTPLLTDGLVGCYPTRTASVYPGVDGDVVPQILTVVDSVQVGFCNARSLAGRVRCKARVVAKEVVRCEQHLLHALLPEMRRRRTYYPGEPKKTLTHL